MSVRQYLTYVIFNYLFLGVATVVYLLMVNAAWQYYLIGFLVLCALTNITCTFVKLLCDCLGCLCTIGMILTETDTTSTTEKGIWGKQ